MRRRRERGSAMIEAALILSMLVAILVGLVDFSRYMLASTFVSYAAREGTRFAQVRGAQSKAPATPQSVEAYVKGLAMGVDPASIHVRTEWQPDNHPGSTVKVQVEAAGMSGRSAVVILN